MSHAFPYKTVTTKKKHQCWGCANKFEPGTKMTYSAGVSDDGFWSIYFCEKCNSFMNSKNFSWGDHEDGIHCGDLKEYDTYKDFKNEE